MGVVESWVNEVGVVTVGETLGAKLLNDLPFFPLPVMM